jgi:hypothetical protein
LPQRQELGSSIQKHQGQGNFPRVKKGVGDPGKLGREQLEDILTDPAAIAVRPRTGNAAGGTRIIRQTVAEPRSPQPASSCISACTE